MKKKLKNSNKLKISVKINWVKKKSINKINTKFI